MLGTLAKSSRHFRFNFFKMARLLSVAKTLRENKKKEITTEKEQTRPPVQKHNQDF